MRWPQWYPTRGDVTGISFVLPRLVGCLLVAVLWSGAPAHSAYFGVGINSCANWQTKGNDFQGKAWILGYWSGLSSMDEAGDIVGNETDAAAIFAEVALICTKNPSMKLREAVLSHYLRLKSSKQ
jgi:hypothetical protein